MSVRDVAKNTGKFHLLEGSCLSLAEISLNTKIVVISKKPAKFFD